MVLVDDDPDLGDALREALLLEGFDLHVTDSAEEASSLVARLAPEVVLIDYQVPGVDPRGLVTTLRRLTSAPMVLCTGMGRAFELRDEVGADAVLCKPFRVEDVVALANGDGQPAATS
jgi:DNA-binding response OmpR family regulator